MSKEVRTHLLMEATRLETWRALTTQEGVTSFFCDEAEINLMVGGQYTLSLQGSLKDGGEVLEMDYLQILTLQWNHPKNLGGGSSTVSFALEPVRPDATRVVVIHTFDDADGDRMAEGIITAWDEVLGRLWIYLGTLRANTKGAGDFWSHV